MALLVAHMKHVNHTKNDLFHFFTNVILLTTIGLFKVH